MPLADPVKTFLRLDAAFWLLAVLSAGAIAAEKAGSAAGVAGRDPKPRPSITASLNNNPKLPAAWRNPLDGAAVDVSNTPGIMVNGSGFKNGQARIAVYLAGRIAAKGEIKIKSETFQTLLPLKSPLADPRELTVRVGDDFSQSVPVRLRRLRGTARLLDGSPVLFPLVTNGLFRSSGFFVTTVGDKNGNFEILIPEEIAFLSIFEKNSSKTRLECRKHDAGLKEKPRLEICIEPHLRFVPDNSLK